VVTWPVCWVVVVPISSNSEGSNKLPDDGRLLPKHVGANIFNKGVVLFSAYVGYFATYNNAQYNH
jgi:hypothetical protein